MQRDLSDTGRPTKPGEVRWSTSFELVHRKLRACVKLFTASIVRVCVCARVLACVLVCACTHVCVCVCVCYER